MMFGNIFLWVLIGVVIYMLMKGGGGCCGGHDYNGRNQGESESKH